MVKAKRIHKSESEIWTIVAKGELDGKTVYGPTLKLENLNPNDLTRHFAELAHYIVIQWLSSMTNSSSRDTVEIISCRLDKLIREFTKFTPKDFDNSGVSFFTIAESLFAETLPCTEHNTMSSNVYLADVTVELKSQNGDIYELQTVWQDIEQALKACDIIL